MALTKKDFSSYIKLFNFKELFNDMGWNNDKTAQSVAIDNDTYHLQAVAEKSGFKILICNPTKEGVITDYNTRKKIETKITKLFQEHLIIFIDAKKQEQIWQLVVRQTGKPTKVTETRYHISQDPELLFQRAAGIFFEMDEEYNITIVDVTKRVAENFHQNNEKVTKQFYESFKKQHTSFLSFIKGIDGKADKDWYASLMLNRLMFCYFIQKKGFLDRNKNYLRDKLKLCTSKNGKDKFYSFYRSFLLVLFHEGLNEPAQKEKIKIEIGKIPYLNGGLFDEHELEKSYEIDINDKAFERIFDFFDEYEWHLDTRIEATGKDINPDVIGYIFEKYINDRAQMGAYYTKEDITDYISKNCIIPWLFDETARHYPKAFAAAGEIWPSLKESGDAYIYDAVKHGSSGPLPKAIQAGIKDVGKRSEWNKQASSELSLPTEIWREVVERRHRYEELKAKITGGEISTINDFITYNLNIRQFTQDTIENSDDPDFIRNFYKALNTVTIIDPTCGSGAFLFAAMNILEPLYHACIMRMRAFTEDEDRENEQEKKTFKNKYKYFREVLENIQSEQHPNLQYFIYKSIILNNLYGVDIMREAVEIAKLRLFLKLVATVEADYKKKNLGLEPLPDIDFNIRSGNTLIGFATQMELIKGLRYTLDGVAAAPIIEEKCDIVAKAFTRYKAIQLSYGDDYKEFKKAKEILNKRLKELNSELNKLLHKQAEGIKYEKWLESHKPFHWFAEFYEIIHDKTGFDVIIGNPPYVEYSKVKNTYSIKNYLTEKCGNLYAFVMEKMMSVCNKDSYTSFIVPLAGVSTDRMMPLQKLLIDKNQYLISLFIESTSNPSQLFNGVKVQLVIHNYKRGLNKAFKSYTTNYLRFYSSERANLFDKIYLINLPFNTLNNRVPKICNLIELKILDKINKKKKYLSNYYASKYDKKIYYRRLGNFFFKLAFLNPPLYRVNNKKQLSSTVEVAFIKDIPNEVFIGIINSSLIYWFWVVFSNVMDFKLDLVSLLKFDYETLDKEQSRLFSRVSHDLIDDLEANQLIGIENRRNGDYVEVGRYFPQKSKPLIDKIDRLLALHYGFTEEETEYIINYDIKYRMGKDLECDEEE